MVNLPQSAYFLVINEKTIHIKTLITIQEVHGQVLIWPVFYQQTNAPIVIMI